ncbi:MAG: molybdopterin-dependent oxidoreductase [Thermomicrobiales bacterium]
MLADVAVFALSLYWFIPLILGKFDLLARRADVPAESQSRRRLIGQVVAGGIGLVGLGYLGNFVVGLRAGAPGGREGEISPPITPVPEFYTVSKNIIDPSVGLGGWSLGVAGMVEREINLNLDDLLAFPAVEQQATLTCISNPIGGDLIDNATWTGVRLADVLAQAGIQGEPGRVAFYGEDGYSDSFEFSKALEPTTIIAYFMNGEPLTDKHGFPARLIVPGKYGIKNGKWLRRIELVDEFRGYWQHRGWTNEGNVKTISLFERPLDRAVLSNEPQEIGGLAFAGPRGISKVELSLDDGETWTEVEDLYAPSPLSWTIWRTLWTPADSGAYELKVRATDGTGALQSPEQSDPEPDGASGYHRIVVGIA